MSKSTKTPKNPKIPKSQKPVFEAVIKFTIPESLCTLNSRLEKVPKLAPKTQNLS